MESVEETELCFPQLLNSSCRRTVRPHSVSTLIYVLLSSVSLLTVVLNLLVVVSISHFKRLHTPTNLLLLSLAISDLLVGLLMFFQLMLIDGCWFFGDLTCSLYFLLDYIITCSSIGTMVLISVDRYVAICDPLRYCVRVTAGRVKVCVSLCWVLSVAFQCVLLRDNLLRPGRFSSCTGECVVVVAYVDGVVDVLASFVGPVGVVVVLYLRVLAVAVSQARAVRAQVTATTNLDALKFKVKKSRVKALKSVSVVILVFLVCTCPYFCVTLSGGDSVLSASSVAFVMCLFYLNSCLNPLIYALFYPWFRKSTKLIISLQILESGSSQANVL